MTDNPTPCQKCGQTHPRCAAHNTAGRPCGKARIDGATVCWTHGGSTPQVREKAAQRVRFARAVQEMHTFGEAAIDGSPEDVILDLMLRAYGKATWLDWKASQQPVFTKGAFGPSISPYVQLAGVWSDKAANYARIAKDMGVAESQIRLMERYGELMAGGVMWLLTRLGADDERGRALAAEMFRALAVGQLPEGRGA